MGTRQELGLFVLVMWLALVAVVDRPVPAGGSGVRPGPSRADPGRVCPLQGPAMNGMRCVLLGMRIPVNQAAAVDLEVIPGIGPVLARRIVETRDRVGGFGSHQDLQQVHGIGPGRAGVMRAWVVFSP